MPVLRGQLYNISQQILVFEKQIKVPGCFIQATFYAAGKANHTKDTFGNRDFRLKFKCLDLVRLQVYTLSNF
jgi:hypothetical protein